MESDKVFDFRGIPRFFDLDDVERSKIIDNLFEGIRLGAPKQLSVTFNNEREVMICEQALRMLRGVASERLVGDYWDNASNEFLSVHEATSYRAKPNKELVVPWEWIEDKYDTINVDVDGNVFASNSSGLLWGSTFLKLDLTDVELPVTVKRPE